MLHLKSFSFSPIQENTYIVYNEHKNAIIIDPGMYHAYEEVTLKKYIDDNQLNVKFLLNTHCHLDHVFGNVWVNKTYNLLPHIHPLELPVLKIGHLAGEKWGLPFINYNGALIYLNEGDKMLLDEDELSIIHLPGHSPGSIGFYCQKQDFIISGDVLFAGGMGRTDLPFCKHEDLMNSIKNKLFLLPHQTTIYSGHGTTTTIGEEIITFQNNGY